METRKNLFAALAAGWHCNTFARLSMNDPARRCGFQFLYFLEREGDLLAMYVS